MKSLKIFIISLFVLFNLSFGNVYSDIRIEIKSQIEFYRQQLYKLRLDLVHARDRVEVRKIRKKMEVIFDKILELEKKLEKYEKCNISG